MGELYGLTAAAGTAFGQLLGPEPKSTFVAGLGFFSAGVREVILCWDLNL